ncbi:MAG: hypothetical protein RBT41_04125 [Clostridia bacterium]|nr:hypothetical protein [Clostridia bacterium]
MKLFIFPVICAILLVIGFRQINPDMAIMGIAISALMGLGVGVGLNNLVFRTKGSNSQNKQV